MDLKLAGRVFVLTGATSGLGLASAQALLEEGAHVQVSSRSRDRVEEAVSELSAEHAGRVRGVVADNADPGSAGMLVARAVEAWGRLDGLLISVGGPPGGSMLTATDDEWQDAFNAIFLGAIRLVRAAVAELGDGSAVGLVLSSSVRQPIANLAISNGLRPGLAMVAKTLADELGERGIRVVSLIPGRITTPRTLEVDHAGSDSDARNRAIPLRRMGDASEFGQVAAFVLSPVASYITGSMVTVDGGLIRSL